MKYLIDTTALVRILRRQVDETWPEQVTRGMAARRPRPRVARVIVASAAVPTSHSHHQ